jgi:hypothetical protein
MTPKGCDYYSMAEISPAEARRQADVLWPIRWRHHTELGYSGIARRIIAATTKLNEGKSRLPLIEGSLVYPARAPIDDHFQELRQRIRTSEPGMTLLLGGLVQLETDDSYVLALGRRESLGPDDYTDEVYYAGVQYPEPFSQERPTIQSPFEGIEQEDVNILARMLGEVADAKEEHSLTCLNDNLVNNQITGGRLLPLP